MEPAGYLLIALAVILVVASVASGRKKKANDHQDSTKA